MVRPLAADGGFSPSYFSCHAGSDPARATMGRVPHFLPLLGEDANPVSVSLRCCVERGEVITSEPGRKKKRSGAFDGN